MISTRELLEIQRLKRILIFLLLFFLAMKPPFSDRIDEETLAGLNKMAKTGAVTSTPANGFAPPIEDPIEG